MQDTRQHHVRIIAAALLGALVIVAMTANGPVQARGKTGGGVDLGNGIIRHSEQGHSTGDTPPFPVVPVGYQVNELVSGLGTMRTVAGPDTNGLGGGLYVVMPETNEIVVVDADGAVETFTDLSEITPDGYPSSPTIDRLGTYGGSLFVADMQHDFACEVDPEGGASIFTTLSDGGPIAFDPHGAFGGKLYATDSFGDVLALETDGTTTLLATGHGTPGDAMTFTTDGAFGDMLLIADSVGRRILGLDPQHPAGTPAPVWVDLETSGIVPVSVAVSEGGPFGQGLALVVDAAAGRIVRLAPDGSYVDTFVSGLGDPVSVELPSSGAFAGRMLITVEDRVWVVERTK
ncbi:MAG: SMP-30/gluconolactonase/LRE family protein [Planctomycetota bacterium]|jgi:hypothetical protein